MSKSANHDVRKYTAMLTCHPGTSSQAVYGVEASVSWTGDGTLALSYALSADVARLRIPPPRPPRRGDCLWQHTCFEAFVSVKGSSAYHELNFAPSGEWAAYTFDKYREGTSLLEQGLDPKITVRSAEKTLELDALVRLDRLPRIVSQTRLRLGLSAVIEEENGRLSYWTLKHPPGNPDFHHPDAFALELEPPIVQIMNDADIEKR